MKKIKKFLCGLLIATILFTSTSVNSVDIIAATKADELVAYYVPGLTEKGETVTNYLYFKPTFEVKKDTSFIVTLAGGTFSGDAPVYNGAGSFTYERLMEELSYNVIPDMTESEKQHAIIDSYYALMNSYSSQIPYLAEKLNDTQMKITLAPIPNAAAGEAGIITRDIPYYKIPMTVTASGSKVTANIKSDDSRFNGRSVLLVKTNRDVKTDANIIAYYSPELVNKGETVENHLYINIKEDIKYDDVLAGKAYFDVELDGGVINGDAPVYKGQNGFTYEKLMNELSENIEPGMNDSAVERALIDSYRDLLYSTSNELPYYAEKISDTKMRIYLAPVPESAVASTGVITGGKPCFKIPVTAKVNGTVLTANTTSAMGFADGASVMLAKTDNSIKEELSGNAARINKIADLSNGNAVNGVNLILTPQAGMKYDLNDKDDNSGKRSLIITVNNGKFTYAPTFGYVNGMGYSELMNEINMNVTSDMSESEKNWAIRDSYLGFMRSNTVFLPYKAELLNEKQMKVTLPPVPDDAALESGVILQGIPKFRIPLPVEASGADDVSITADFKVTAFRGDTYNATIATSDISSHMTDSSVVSVDRIAAVEPNGNYDRVNLRVVPKNEVPLDTVITITAKSGTFGDVPVYNANGVTYENVMDIISDEALYAANEQELQWTILDTYLDLLRYNTSSIPFFAEKVSDTQLKIHLAPIPEMAADEAGVISYEKPYYMIPLAGTAADKNVVVKVESELTDFMHSGITVAMLKGAKPDETSTVTTVEATTEVTTEAITEVTTEVQTESETSSPETKESTAEYEAVGGKAYFDTASGMLTSCDSTVTEITIPEKINGVSIKGIKPDAFKDCVNLARVYCIKGSPADNKALYPANVEIIYTDNTYILGDADADNAMTASDAAVILQKVLNGAYKMPIETKTGDFMRYVDADADKLLTASDAAYVLQKVLNDSFVLPAEEK